jgi:putative NADPH-quinone reductase
MARTIVYYAHPGHRYSRVNKEMARVAESREDVTFVDLYKEYPRTNINVDKEQERLLSHDVIIFQHPLFWYSVPSLVKEWIDLVLEHGFAFGHGGDKLSGKILMNAISAAGPDSAYTNEGYQHYPLRTFLTPLEQTARLCHMRYAAPYVLYSALNVSETEGIPAHVNGYMAMLNAICSDQYDLDKACAAEVITAETVSGFLRSTT